jgi:hypothetical protein
MSLRLSVKSGSALNRVGDRRLAAVVKGHHEVGAAAATDSGSGVGRCSRLNHIAPRVSCSVFSRFGGTIDLHAGLSQLHIRVLSAQYFIDFIDKARRPTRAHVTKFLRTELELLKAIQLNPTPTSKELNVTVQPVYGPSNDAVN